MRVTAVCKCCNNSDRVDDVCLPIGHARKAVCVLSSPTSSATARGHISNCLPAEEMADGGSSSSDSDEDDDREAFTYDPTLLEDRELGFHVS